MTALLTSWRGNLADRFVGRAIAVTIVPCRSRRRALDPRTRVGVLLLASRDRAGTLAPCPTSAPAPDRLSGRERDERACIPPAPGCHGDAPARRRRRGGGALFPGPQLRSEERRRALPARHGGEPAKTIRAIGRRSEEHTSELQSQSNLV